jgi:DNA primase
MIYEQIKNAVTMEEVAHRYGFTPDRGGYIPCPFHKENTASLKVYPGKRGFYCYGCGKSGSVLDFVMQHFGINIHQAAVRLNADFHLGLIKEKLSPAERVRVEKERRASIAAREKAERELKQYREEYDDKCREHQRLWETLQLCRPASPEDEPSFAFQIILNHLTYLDHWFNTHEFK